MSSGGAVASRTAVSFDFPAKLAPSCPTAMPRHDLAGLPNFAQVSQCLYRGAQPSREGFDYLSNLGIRSVVNLRGSQRDRKLLIDSPLQYFPLRCRAWWPSTARIAEFLKIVQDPARLPVFVHCLHGSDRTGLLIAAYRIIEHGWSRAQAEQELHAFGFHAKCFPQIGTYLKRVFQEDKVRAHMEGLPAVEPSTLFPIEEPRKRASG